MPANGRWDLIRRLKVNAQAWSLKLRTYRSELILQKPHLRIYQYTMPPAEQRLQKFSALFNPF